MLRTLVGGHALSLKGQRCQWFPSWQSRLWARSAKLKSGADFICYAIHHPSHPVLRVLTERFTQKFSGVTQTRKTLFPLLAAIVPLVTTYPNESQFLICRADIAVFVKSPGHNTILRSDSTNFSSKLAFPSFRNRTRTRDLKYRVPAPRRIAISTCQRNIHPLRLPEDTVNQFSR